MGTKVWTSHLASLTLLLLSWRKTGDCSGLTVAPPQDLTVSDPGQLGHLVITWSPPASVGTLSKCSVGYQLEYFDASSNTWVVTRTKLRTHSADFDLMKDVRVRVYTLLEGLCTKNTVIKSTNYAEVVQKPSNKGVADTQVHDFDCVFYNMKYTECTWKRSSKTPANAQQNLYFWHKGLAQAVECPKYITWSGVKTGCNFTESSLPIFTHINLCVNGSSLEGPLKQTFISLEIQNRVKPAPVEKIYLQTDLDGQPKLHWEPPAGAVSHCLKWEVEHSREDSDGTMSKNRTFTKQTSLSLPPVHPDEGHCWRVRSRVHKYCADESFWSEWSRRTCHPDKAATVGDFGGTTEGPSPVSDRWT